MEYSWATHAMAWVNLNIILSKRGRTHKTTYDILKNAQILVTENGALPEVRGEGRGLTAKGNEKTFWGDQTVLYFDFGNHHMPLYLCQKSLNCILKIVELYCM